MDITTFAFLFGLVVLLYVLFTKKTDAEKLVIIEKKIDLLLEQSGIDFDARHLVSKPVLDAITSGNKLKAIRLHREETGASLKSAAALYNEVKVIQEKHRHELN